MHNRSFQSGDLRFALGVVLVAGADDVGERVEVGLGMIVVDAETTGVVDGPKVVELETAGAGGEIAGVGLEATGCGVDATGFLVAVGRCRVVLTGTTRGFVAGGLLSKFDKMPGTAAMPFERRSSRGFF